MGRVYARGPEGKDPRPFVVFDGLKRYLERGEGNSFYAMIDGKECPVETGYRWKFRLQLPLRKSIDKIEVKYIKIKRKKSSSIFYVF